MEKADALRPLSGGSATSEPRCRSHISRSSIIAGRPKLRNARIAKIICAEISKGRFLKDAAAHAGISYDTLERWQREDSNFAARIEAAIAKRPAPLFRHVYRMARTNFNAARWLIERMRPEYKDQPTVAPPQGGIGSGGVTVFVVDANAREFARTLVDAHFGGAAERLRSGSPEIS